MSNDGNGSANSMDNISSFVGKKVGGRERKLRRKGRGNGMLLEQFHCRGRIIGLG